MTIFGVDLASYQTGEDLGALTNISFVMAKCTQGTTYVDPPYAGWRSAAQSAGRIFVAYHFLIQQDSPTAQAKFVAANIGNKAIPLMIDVETDGASKPTLSDILAFADAAKALGLRVKLAYMPMWYWALIGSPNLGGLTERGIGVISSNYPRSAAAGALATYATDGQDVGEGWTSYGGITPVIWQFADDAPEAGRSNDINAYRGTPAQLAAFLGSDTMQDTPPVGAGPFPAEPTLRLGATGNWVTQLQGDLTAQAFPTMADGNFGPLTQVAVRAFQAYAGISIDGVVGPVTWSKLAQPSSGMTAATPTLREGYTGSSVTRMQSYLMGDGFSPGGIDGNFGVGTKISVIDFQTARSLARDGVCGPVTWAALIR